MSPFSLYLEMTLKKHNDIRFFFHGLRSNDAEDQAEKKEAYYGVRNTLVQSTLGFILVC